MKKYMRYVSISDISRNIEVFADLIVFKDRVGGLPIK